MKSMVFLFASMIVVCLNPVFTELPGDAPVPYFCTTDGSLFDIVIDDDTIYIGGGL